MHVLMNDLRPLRRSQSLVDAELVGERVSGLFFSALANGKNEPDTISRHFPLAGKLLSACCLTNSLGAIDLREPGAVLWLPSSLSIATRGTDPKAAR